MPADSFAARLTDDTVSSPRLVLDLDTVAHRYAELAAALPEAVVYYAVKANPEPEVVELLGSLGARYDVASPGEIERCLRAGAPASRLSYGNPVKKHADIAFAHRSGVDLFTTDSEGDLRAIARHAPGAHVLCRIRVDVAGAWTPFGDKFGCDEDTATALLRLASELGLRPYGLTFHVGSQHMVPTAWGDGIAAAARIDGKLAADGIELDVLDLGGGFPTSYRRRAPAPAEYGAAIRAALDRHFGSRRPTLLIEPGRALVADAGTIECEVVAVTRRGSDPRRWVYLDVGRYNGLAETENEAIAYRLRTPHDGQPTGPVVLAGPTCDGDDVLYRHTPYELPLALRSGDRVEILSAGAYTASYSSVYFNGFEPLPTHVVGGRARPTGTMQDSCHDNHTTVGR